MHNRFFFLLISICFLSTKNSAQNIQFSREDSSWAQKIYLKMNTKERVAQLFMADISPRSENANDKKRMIDLVKKKQIGGIIIMKGDYSLTSEWIRDFQKAAKTPLLIAIDGEWGINMRIANTTKFPYALTLGALENDSLIYEMGKAMGRDCRRLGIHINFGPVADVNINPKNPVINYRSFGENKFRVGQKAMNCALGMQSQGVMACAKHFPGHGDTDVDSHFDLPVINKAKDVLEDLELHPFQKLIDANIWSIMVAHLKVPTLDPNKPTSLSKAVITDLLKKDMGFQGLVISDALNMKGVSDNNEAGQMELEAYIAGNDILLMSTNTEKAIDKITTYILASSDINVSKDLDARVFKILLFKHKLNVSQSAELVYSNDETSNISLSEKLYAQSITFLSKDKTESQPIIQPNSKTLFISLADNQTEFKRLMESYSGFTFTRLSKNNSESEYRRLVDGLAAYEQIIIAYQDLSQNAKSNFGLSTQQIRFIQDISTMKNSTHIWFGNPYGLKHFQNANNIIITYEDNAKTQNAVFNLLRSNSKLTGVLPVSVGKFKEGTSYLSVKQIAQPLKTISVSTTTNSTPIIAVDEADLAQLDRAAVLARVESLCGQIVTNNVAPGGQIYVLHKGKEIYNKSFGYQTYAADANAVKMSDYYDLASVSKIMGTTLAVMKLKDMGKLRITDKVGDYLILDETNTVADITLQQLLTHEAGLTPFIPYYQRFNDTNFYNYFDTKASAGFSTEVADHLYIRDDYKDSIWYETTHHERKNIGKYKYSDLSMYILQRVVEKAAGMGLDEFLYKNFYKPMGLGLTYNPIHKYPKSRIAPTEMDAKFRLQLVHGYVHDQGCALYGGVCGHSGLFGTAKDVATVMQMLIQGGTYNNKTYIKPETISLFTAQQSFNSRRGLGFDKPNVDDLSTTPTSSQCSFATFGHTGFTGTCAWADPFNDLVFVFLSNRVYPNAENKKLAKGNYRERLQSLFYQYVK
jgi:beta-N-acetylhexosaminidase